MTQVYVAIRPWRMSQWIWEWTDERENERMNDEPEKIVLLNDLETCQGKALRC